MEESGMHLEGSCHCGAVRFALESPHPYPFNRCYCSICRKTTGSGGYAINIGGLYDTLKIEGEEHINVYQAKIRDPQNGELETSPGRRHFCKHCGSALWMWDPRWPELVHPLASAIDTDLPRPPAHTHMMLGSKANWVEVHAGPHDRQFEAYPDESLAQWHQRWGLEEKDD
jgi:hypothetical protein